MKKISNENKKEKCFFGLSVCGYIVACALFLFDYYKWCIVFFGVGAFFALFIKTEMPEIICFPKEPLTDDEIEELQKLIEDMK